MKSRYLFLSVIIALVAILLLLNSLETTVHATATEPTSLSYQANIYGGPGLENIEYMSDLKFYSWGGFGVNAHVVRSRLRSGDEIAYAISANDPDAFSFNIVDQFSNTLQIHVTNSMYSAGIVTQPTTDTLHFVWEIEDQGIHLNLHRLATLESEPNVTTQHIFREKFSIENLGTPFTLTSFIEYWHMDDRARIWDYDSDGRDETLTAINSYSTSGYPVFGKVYVKRPNLETELISGGRYATVNHSFNFPFATNAEQNISEAVYVSSTALNGIEADRQVAEDAKYLLNVADRLTLEFPSSLLTSRNTQNWITSYFDHEYPVYEAFPNNQGNAFRNIVPYWGDRRGAGTAASCNNDPTSSAFCYDGHDGYDFGVTGIIMATADGEVIYVGCNDANQNPPTGSLPCSRRRNQADQWRDGLGLMVVISHTNSYATIYGHLATVSVTQGITVTSGITLGLAGNTGNSRGTHLHFNVQLNGKDVDPFGWIPGEVLIDPNTQPITNTNTGAILYQGEASVCLWKDGCPTNQWVNPNQTTIIPSKDGAASLSIPSNAITVLTHFSLLPAFDPVASNESVPTGYSYDIRAWDKTGNSITSFQMPLELTIHYDDEINANVDEETLGIFWWDDSQPGWVEIATILDIVNNTAIATLNHLSWFSLRGIPINPAPQLSSVTPQEISTETPVILTISGANFSPNADVWLGKAKLPFALINLGTIQVTVPAWEPNGVYDVKIVNPDYQKAVLTAAVEVSTPFRLFLPSINQ